MSESLLEVDNLRVTYDTPKGSVQAVRGVSFSMTRERLALVGESGSGKSQTGRAILRLITPPGRIEADRLIFAGHDLLTLSERQMRTVRGRRISMVLQDPRYSLNPVMRIGPQILEACRHSRSIGRSAGRAKVLEMLSAVRIHDPERVYRAYPHQVSGGMGQRIMIAMMLIGEPDLLIADEPTSALDVTVQQQVLEILDDLVARRGMGLLFISHDLNLVRAFCDRVLVMYGGRIVEEIAAANLNQARHPYTQGLLRCLPKLNAGQEPLPVLNRDPAWLI
ncbi:MAG: ABC transporter ATP-binding protein [Gammaproteobacteria bacterium]|nr:ABC transporter ATP-binding protein [Gammaproteobacteria bacterium]